MKNSRIRNFPNTKLLLTKHLFLNTFRYLHPTLLTGPASPPSRSSGGSRPRDVPGCSLVILPLPRDSTCSCDDVYHDIHSQPTKKARGPGTEKLTPKLTVAACFRRRPPAVGVWARRGLLRLACPAEARGGRWPGRGGIRPTLP